MNLWTKAISQEMEKVKVTFSHWDGGTLDEARNGKISVGFQEIGDRTSYNLLYKDGW